MIEAGKKWTPPAGWPVITRDQVKAALCAPIAAAYFGRYDLVALLVACTLIVFWKHRTNIESLLDGTEPRIGKSKS
ncbi:MAG: hypothetical protein B7Y00_08275 [Sphingomonadales bacterium 17-56-6]|nr:MAG: hypothetical protein B7Y00_08275 [Sphingomonadales bacterium 17-56-6]